MQTKSKTNPHYTKYIAIKYNIGAVDLLFITVLTSMISSNKTTVRFSFISNWNLVSYSSKSKPIVANFARIFVGEIC